jgi:diaminopimelate decarboxylase
MPSTAAVDTRFRLADRQAQEILASFGTPQYVVDEAHFRARIRSYVQAFAAAHPKTEVVYASKANSTLALIAIAHAEGCKIDVASEGELRAALAAGVPGEACHLHGNNKQVGELEFALGAGVAHIVVDHFGEIETLAALRAHHGHTKLVLRLAPGVDPVTHAKISTGQADTKFGFNISDGSAEKATKRCLELGLPLIGFHCHVGSQLLDPEAQRSGGELIAKFAVDMQDRHGFAPQYLNVGGGLGVSYTLADQPMDVKDYCRLVVEAISGALKGTSLESSFAQITLGQEPGRSLIGESGVTLYRVGLTKEVPAKEIGTRTYVAVDGGLSDNPRPAMYGSKYTVELVGRSSREPCKVVTVSGKHCETDKLFVDIELPADVQDGDLLQVLVTGAYNSSMASNYNRYPRPGTVLIRQNGTMIQVQRPETWDEMFARECVPADLVR